MQQQETNSGWSDWYHFHPQYIKQKFKHTVHLTAEEAGKRRLACSYEEKGMRWWAHSSDFDTINLF